MSFSTQLLCNGRNPFPPTEKHSVELLGGRVISADAMPSHQAGTLWKRAYGIFSPYNRIWNAYLNLLYQKFYSLSTKGTELFLRHFVKIWKWIFGQNGQVSLSDERIIWNLWNLDLHLHFIQQKESPSKNWSSQRKYCCPNEISPRSWQNSLSVLT